jgi:hypothetical protein
MEFYHYTALNRLDSIRAEGLNQGDVPLSPTKGLNAVWLTTDIDPRGHGLGVARPLTETERYAMQRWNGFLPSAGARWDDKREARINVEIADNDPNLVDWYPWAIVNLEESWRKSMSRTGGGLAKAKSWRLYFGVILPSAFTSITDLTRLPLHTGG